MRPFTVFAAILLVAAAIGCVASSDSDTTPVPTIAPEQTVAREPGILTHELEVIIQPTESAIFQLNPKSIGGRRYVQGRTVTIDVLPRPGWQRDKWLGPVFEVGETLPRSTWT